MHSWARKRTLHGWHRTLVPWCCNKILSSFLLRRMLGKQQVSLPTLLSSSPETCNQAQKQNSTEHLCISFSRFSTRKECENTCNVSPPVRGITPTTDAQACVLEPATGPCRAAFTRYYFDVAGGQCKQFTYGGKLLSCLFMRNWSG